MDLHKEALIIPLSRDGTQLSRPKLTETGWANTEVPHPVVFVLWLVIGAAKNPISLCKVLLLRRRLGKGIAVTFPGLVEFKCKSKLFGGV